MQIVIELSEKDYDDITLTGENTINLGVLLALRKAVRNGTPLPKGHGRLIDADALIYSLSPSDRDIYCKGVIEEEAPTIIEADRGE